MSHHSRDSPSPAIYSFTVVPPIIQPDIFSSIMPFCDNHDLVQLSLVCRALDYQIIPSLYRQITIDFHRGRMILPRVVTDDRYPFASIQKENDKAPITPRFVAALRYSRIVLIRGHHRPQCQARHFTFGLPTQMIEALENVHTVRLLTLPAPYLTTTIAGLCDVGGPEPCHLVHILRDRYAIYSRPPDGFSVLATRKFPGSEQMTISYDHSPPISAITEIPGRQQILIHADHPSEGNWVEHNLPLTVFDAPITVIVQLPTGRKSKINLTTYTKLLMNNTIKAGFSPSHPGIRFVCEKEMIRDMNQVKADCERIAVTRAVERSVTAEQGVKKVMDKIQVVSLDEVMTEPWVEVFKGIAVKDWY